MTDATATVNGTLLTVGVPTGLQASAIPGGLLLQQSGEEQKRQVYRMTITLVDPAGPAPAVPLDRTRGEGGGTVRYALDRYDGGSGGSEVMLIARRACARGTVQLRFDAQGEEGGDVDLEPAFAVLEKARCTAAA